MVSRHRPLRAVQAGPSVPAPAAPRRPTTVLDRLGPVLKAKVMLALVGLIVLGLGLIALVLLGGRAVRRQARRRSVASGANRDSGPSPPFPQAEYLRGPMDDRQTFDPEET